MLHSSTCKTWFPKSKFGTGLPDGCLRAQPTWDKRPPEGRLRCRPASPGPECSCSGCLQRQCTGRQDCLGGPLHWEGQHTSYLLLLPPAYSHVQSTQPPRQSLRDEPSHNHMHRVRSSPPYHVRQGGFKQSPITDARLDHIHHTRLHHVQETYSGCRLMKHNSPLMRKDKCRVMLQSGR